MIAQVILAVAPVADKAFDCLRLWLSGTAYKSGYADGLKVGLLYGASGMFLLVVVVGAVIFIIKQMQSPPNLGYAV
ncbi:hypothetical protein [Iningainema tapete]|uniref:Uncharacterized protein n=1 Tax=Iningainema tapete BLCC-T55 TaxID=2748662 RepID=A0A8J6XN62_9CYAN|nr:hypothetical protein [Iningainema tapete]MBD2776292.1 hypothetical protein [Iningainema tapete BLCC-T55]